MWRSSSSAVSTRGFLLLMIPITTVGPSGT